MNKAVLIDDWHDFSNAVPVEEKTKQRWIEEAVAYLEKNPDEYVYTIASGDTLILVRRDEDGSYEVSDLKVRKEGSFKPVTKPEDCVCDMNLLIKSGCQCGGN